ncbi:MAG: hypothetical protein ABSG89_10175 [Bacteroidales bacterium]|jgi:hypothetical protein
MGNLEDHIKKNREDLDRLDPSPELWKGIRRSLHGSKPGLIKLLSAAAVIIIVLFAAVFRYKGELMRNSASARGNNYVIIMNGNPQLKESEFYYNSLVNDLYHQVSPLLAKYPDAGRELKSDMSQIDSICLDLRKDLKDNVDNREVIEAMINNYRIKIQILEDMLATLKQNESSNKKKDNHEL